MEKIDTNILFHIEQKRKENRTSNWLQHKAEFDTLTFNKAQLSIVYQALKEKLL